jgi:hypothetical protein
MKYFVAHPLILGREGQFTMDRKLPFKSLIIMLLNRLQHHRRGLKAYCMNKNKL